MGKAKAIEQKYMGKNDQEIAKAISVIFSVYERQIEES